MRIGLLTCLALVGVAAEEQGAGEQPAAADDLTVAGWQWQLPGGWQRTVAETPGAVHGDGRHVGLNGPVAAAPPAVAAEWRAAWQGLFSGLSVTADVPVTVAGRAAQHLRFQHRFADGERHWAAWFLATDDDGTVVFIVSAPTAAGLEQIDPPQPVE